MNESSSTQATVCRLLQNALSTRGLTQRELGEKLSEITGEAWPQQRVWKVLHGKITISVDLLGHVARAFNLSLSELLCNAPPPMPPEVEDYIRQLQAKTTGGLVVVFFEVKPTPRSEAIVHERIA